MNMRITLACASAVLVMAVPAMAGSTSTQSEAEAHDDTEMSMDATQDAGTGDAAMATDILVGVYSPEQAEAGAAVFDDSCAACHAGNLRGTPGAPGLIGIRFDLRWEEETLGEMFTYLKENMPAGNPGSLTDDRYVQAMAHILSVQGYPAGEDVALPTDVEALDQIEIVAVED